MAGAAKTRRRARERRQTSVVLIVVTLALFGSIAMWLLFFKAWTPPAQAHRFALPSSTGQAVALEDFLGKQEVVLVFYMVAT